MSLPDFDPQGSLFSTAGIGTSLFAKDDRYRLFATVIYPCPNNGVASECLTILKVYRGRL